VGKGTRSTEGGGYPSRSGDGERDPSKLEKRAFGGRKGPYRLTQGEK